MNKSVLFCKDFLAAFSIFVKNSRNVIPKYEHIIAPHISSIYIKLYQNCTERVALISSNVMWNIRNEV